MNYKLLFLLSLMSLSGCKTLMFDNTKSVTESQAESSAQEIAAQALLIKEKNELSDFCIKQSNAIDPQAFTDVWKRVQSQLSISVPDTRRVRAQKNWYVNHPSYMKRVTQRASPYLFHIVEELEKNNLPLELALLPIVESAFDPFAYSHGRASGMWQFIPGTGKNFGLKQTGGMTDVVMFICQLRVPSNF